MLPLRAVAIPLRLGRRRPEVLPSGPLHLEQRETSFSQIGPATRWPTEAFNGPSWTGSIGLWEIPHGYFFNPDDVPDRMIRPDPNGWGSVPDLAPTREALVLRRPPLSAQSVPCLICLPRLL
jgi:hypothetical protein